MNGLNNINSTGLAPLGVDSAHAFGSANALAARSLPAWPAASIGLLLVLAILLSPGIITVMDVGLLILATILWLTSRMALPRAFFEIVLPYLGICIAGLLTGIGADLYLYFKDAWYVINPLLIIAVGYALYRAKPDLARGLRAFVIGGTLIGVIYLAPFTLHPELLRLQAADSRELLGAGHFAPALALLILLAASREPREQLCLPRWLAAICLVLCAAACVLSFSRTIVLTTALGALAVYGVFARRAWLKVALVLIGFAALLSLLKTTVDVDSAAGQRSFVGKLARSLDEMSMQEYFDFRRINESYRGYESARALHAYEASGPLGWTLGQGFGALLDLKLWVPGVGRYIPVLHNGYLYLLLKGGALAVLLFLYSLWRTYALGRGAASAEEPLRRLSGRLLQAVALGLGVTTWVISGVFNKLEMYPFLLCAGVLCAHLTSAAAATSVPAARPVERAPS